MSSVSMKSLLEAGVHFGHQKSQWNPKMSKFIFGHRNKVHIIDLAKTVKELKKACKFVRDVAAGGGSILFVGTKHQSQEIVKNEAIRSGAHYVVSRWLGGTLTNFDTIRKNVARLNEIEKMKSDGIFDKLPKKEISKLTKEWKKLDLTLIGIKNMQNLPSAIFIVDPVNEKTAVDESRRLKIPIVAICDTNSDPDVVDYCIPGNDDAIKSINLLVSVIADAVLEGKAAIKTEGTQISVEEKYSSDEQIPMTEAAENKEVVVSQENVPEKQ
ncbi:MAG: 30S ribosomal protein S2 [Elusimicrobia bacterium RIFOXYD2_FULL_34_15]|nr:MAG: 30S ribosomal protein S2 [Elusimicrobia bacterium RIFOXYD2_FULL_34_15]